MPSSLHDICCQIEQLNGLLEHTQYQLAIVESKLYNITREKDREIAHLQDKVREGGTMEDHVEVHTVGALKLAVLIGVYRRFSLFCVKEY